MRSPSIDALVPTPVPRRAIGQSGNPNRKRSSCLHITESHYRPVKARSAATC